MIKKDLPYKNKGDLTTGSIPRHLIRLTIPMIWGILAIISVQLVDTYFISLLGTTELAGISFTFPVTMIITHLVFGINVAISSVVSRMVGEKKLEDAKRVIFHGIFLAFCVSSVIALLTYIFLEPLFRLLGATDETMVIIWDYMPYWLIGSAILAIPVNSNSAIRAAAGDAFLPAIVMSTVALVNLILDPILIFGYFGFPALGVSGAAIATLCGYCCGLFGAVFILVVLKDLIPRDGIHIDKFLNSVKRLIHIAIPAGITNIIQPFTNAVIIALLASYGTEAVAGFGVVSRIEAFAMLLVISLAVGMAPIIGQNWGAENFDRVHKTINLAIGVNFIWSFLVAILFGIFGGTIAKAFSDDATVIHYAQMFFWIVPISYAFGNLVMGWASAFNAMGKPKRSFVMIVVKALVVTIPAVYIGSYLDGVRGIFIGMAAANVSTGILFHWLSWQSCIASEHECEQKHAA